ncbi:MAG: hypothetical protein LBU62_00850 [Bacteroidales bacterium]|jgi:hypothetical protein|nr:hypothetical protein [Bacteroidales bacterium]
MTKQENLSEAKKKFFYFYGSHFHMWHEGEIDKYQNYNISKEQEKEWLKEIFNNDFEKLDIHNNFTIISFAHWIEHHSAIDYLPKFLNFIEIKIDEVSNQYDMLMYGQTVFNIVYELSRQKTKKFSKKLRIKCIYLAEKINEIAKNMQLIESVNIDEIVLDGLTPQVYILRKITELEVKIDIAKINLRKSIKSELFRQNRTSSACKKTL